MSFAPRQAYHDNPLLTPPNVLPLRPEGIPEGLKARPQWIVWKLVKRRNRKWTKKPYDPRTGRLASATDLLTWATFEEALVTFESGGYDGIGFVFCSDDPFCGFDFDDCLAPQTGQIEARALDLIEELGGYREASPSGHGVHVIVKGKLERSVKRGWVEAYATERFFTMTGHVLKARS
jgi:putative DNA primase/helicase